MFFILTSCVSSKLVNDANLNALGRNPNQAILEYIDFLVTDAGKFRIDPNLKFRDYLSMVSERGLVSHYEGAAMRWHCVLDEHPDTSKVMLLPELPNEFMNTIVVAERLDTTDTDYMPAFYFSPVFETKEKGVYAFHESVSFVLTMEGYTDDVIIRLFHRFRIIDGTIEWLDCYGRTSVPFGADPESNSCHD